MTEVRRKASPELPLCKPFDVFTMVLITVEPSSPVSGFDCDDVSDEQLDEEWEDAEPDEENISLTCLFGQTRFKSVHSLLQHCKDAHDFDLANLKVKFGV